jgi:hypothetical protein
MSSMVAKRVPLRPIFRVGKSQKSLGARSGEYGGWVMTGMFLWLGIAAKQAMCGSVRYRDAETTVPATCRVPSPNCIAQPLQNLHIQICPGGTNSWCTKPSAGEFWEPFDCPSYTKHRGRHHEIGVQQYPPWLSLPATYYIHSAHKADNWFLIIPHFKIKPTEIMELPTFSLTLKIRAGILRLQSQNCGVTNSKLKWTFMHVLENKELYIQRCSCIHTILHVHLWREICYC